MKSIVLLVLNYNGLTKTWQRKPLLDFSLPSFIAACAAYPGEASVMVVDNCSTDGSVAYIAKTYPNVVVRNARANRYLFTYNDIIKEIDADIVMFLNTDIWMEPDCLIHVSTTFNNECTFCVGPDICSWDADGPKREPGSRCVRLQYYKGRLFPVDISGMIEHNLPSPSYIMGGASAFDRTMYLNYGGLDELYYPYYWEDTDLAYRASLRGEKIVIQERARVYHLGSQSIDRSKYETECTHLANEYVFMWRTLPTVWHIVKTILYMPWHAFRYRHGGWYYYVKALTRAMKKLPMILKRRKEDTVFSERDKICFDNVDLSKSVRQWIYVKVCISANEPQKALRDIHALWLVHCNDTGYIRRQLQRSVLQALQLLFCDGNYTKVVEWACLFDGVFITADIRYIAASSLKNLKKYDAAHSLFIKIAESEVASSTLRSSAYFHLGEMACQHDDYNEATHLFRKCLMFNQKHNKAYELLQKIMAA